MGFRLTFLSLSILFATGAAWANETKLVHIHVNGVKITRSIEVPNADYDVVAITTKDEITGLRIFGKNMWNQEMNMTFGLGDIRGMRKDFLQTQLPGEPYSFSVTGAPDFNSQKGGVLRFHALSGWTLAFLKHYSYTDLDALIDFEAGTPRASLLKNKGKKLEKLTKITVDVGLTGAGIKTE